LSVRELPRSFEAQCASSLDSASLPVSTRTDHGHEPARSNSVRAVLTERAQNYSESGLVRLVWHIGVGSCNPSTGDVRVYHHVKKLMYTVQVGTPDPRFGNMLLEEFGGANGELAAAMRYSVQGLNCDNVKIKDLLMDIGTEELSHLETVGNLARLHLMPMKEIARPPKPVRSSPLRAAGVSTSTTRRAMPGPPTISRSPANWTSTCRATSPPRLERRLSMSDSSTSPTTPAPRTPCSSS
jgi:Manganese containing catalase